jgi:hypothetical protein
MNYDSEVLPHLISEFHSVLEEMPAVIEGNEEITPDRALNDLKDFIETIRDGDFYTDYDASTYLLRNADRAMRALEKILTKEKELVS